MSFVTTLSPRVVAVIVVAAMTGATMARAADGDNGERARLAEQRSAIEARFVARDAECRKRFVVSACVADTRRDRRLALDALRVRQRVLDDARRQERAAERRAALAAKVADDARRERERAAKAASAPATTSSAPATAAARQGRSLETRREPKPRKPAPPLKSRDRPATNEGAGKARSPKAAPATRQQLEAGNRASFEIRQKEAAQHREETLEATIKRMAKRSSARSLPIPSASAVRAASAP